MSKTIYQRWFIPSVAIGDMIHFETKADGDLSFCSGVMYVSHVWVDHRGILRCKGSCIFYNGEYVHEHTIDTSIHNLMGILNK